MYIFLIILQVLTAGLLIAVILIQQGRGGGLVDSFSGVESIFGAKTNVVLVRATAVLATLFIINSLLLTYLSTQRSKSLMERESLIPQQAGSAATPGAAAQQQTVNTTEQAKDAAPVTVDAAVAPATPTQAVAPETKPEEKIDTNKSQK